MKNLKAEIQNLSEYKKDLENRLKEYTGKTGENPREIINYFKEEADPHNMKPPGEAEKIYCKLMNEFLTETGH
jgi:hypothetical protein